MTLSGQDGMYDAIWPKLRYVNCERFWESSPSGDATRHGCGGGDDIGAKFYWQAVVTS